MELLDSASNDHINNILLNFNRVEIMDNTGISVLVKLHAFTGKSHQNLLAIGVNKSYVDIFSMTGLDKIYRVYASVADVSLTMGTAGPELKNILGKLGGTGAYAGQQFAFWSPLIRKIAAPPMPAEAVNLNVYGRRTHGPVQSFGQLWEKTYTVDLSDTNMSPEQIISVSLLAGPLPIICCSLYSPSPLP